MRRALPYSALLLVLAAPACQDALLVSVPSTPQNLTYEVEPSGTPTQPLGVLLVWNDVPDADLGSYRIYSRGSTSGSFGLRGETTSNTFHDAGVPHLQYYVTAVTQSGGESDASNVVTVNEFLQLEAPATLSSISLNGAIHLRWADNAFVNDPALFKWYRVYSTSYSLDLGECGATWSLEGTTVAPEFLAGALTNGAPRCFGVSAVSQLGYESLWSPLWQDTPRPDARNVLVYAYQENQAQSGFRFWNDANADGRGQVSELGLVQDGNLTSIDFWVHREADSTLWLVPEFTGTQVRLYGAAPIADLTSIDFAPATGYSRNMIQAVPGYGYVFEIVDGSGLHYGALRVTHVGLDYVIFDWSLQTDPGNPELIVRGGMTTSLATGFEVRGSQ